MTEPHSPPSPASSMDVPCLRNPPEAVVSFVRRLMSDHRAPEPDRRAERRQGISLPVLVWPLDNDFQPVGNGYSAVANNISPGGIGLLHHAPITNQYLQLELTSRDGDQMTLAAQLRHCTPCGSYYQIGARFVVDWNHWRRAAAQSSFPVTKSEDKESG